MGGSNATPLKAVIAAAVMAASLIGATAALANETITYTYDARGRLAQINHSGSVNNGVQTSYAQDKADNRTNVTTTGA